MTKRIFFFFLLLFPFISSAQQEINFQSPVDGPMSLSGSFAELRRNHFHTGTDIKTGGEVGKKVYSVEDGYVARISVSPSGYGNALYIAYTNGYTSVYGHLLSFRKDIADFVRTTQNNLESFAIDVDLPPEQFPVSKGDFVALSGNSGSSGGPHVHFEIRETSSEKPLDPMSFNLHVDDHLQPTIFGACVFPYNEYSFINGKNSPLRQRVSGSGSKCSMAICDTIKIQGKVYLAIGTYDVMDGQINKYGPHSITCYLDSTLIFNYIADIHSFNQARCINSIVDYPTYIEKGVFYYKTYFEPNNQSYFLKPTGNNGLIELTDNNIHTITYKVSDIHDNTSTLKFFLRNDSKLYSVKKKDYMFHFSFFLDNNLLFDDFKVNIPQYYLFDDVDFNFSKEDDPSHSLLSPMFHLGERSITSFKSFPLSIKIDSNIPDKLYGKLYIAQQIDGRWSYKGGVVSENWITINTYDFGTYAIKADTIAPTVSCKGLKKDVITNVKGNKSLRIIIKDSESGISDYYPTINGKWILMEYDAKYNALIYNFDDNINKGKNVFKLVVLDKCGNETIITRYLFY